MDLRTPPRDLCAIDTETTSLHPAAEVWEFGAVRRNADGTHATRSLMVANPNLRNADTSALRIGRFYERHPHAAGTHRDTTRPEVLPRGDFARAIASFTHDAILLVNNPTFDVPRLERLLASEQLVPGWWYNSADVVDIARGRIAKTLTEAELADTEAEHGPIVGWSGTLVGDLLGVTPQTDAERHTALGDARWVLRVYDAALGRTNPARAGAQS